MTRRKNPIRRSLNKTVLVLGIEHRLFGGFFFGTIGLFYVTRSFWTAFLFMVAWIAAGRWVSKKDPQFFRILFAGMSEQTRYDAKMSATQEVMDEHPAITEALMFYLLHQVNRQVFGRAASRLKVIVIDEAWAFFRNPLFAEAMKRFLKTARKRNGIVIFATQSLDDLERCEITGVLRDSCLTKVLLANPALDRAKYKEWFGLKDREIDVVANLEPKGPMLVKKPSGSKVVRLRVGPEKHWMYADDPQANAQRAMAIQEHGDRWLEALMEER